MLSITKMKKDEVFQLYNIALRAFQPDYNKYGVYPPLLVQKRNKFLPPLFFGKTFRFNDKIIGGAFINGIGKKGEVGAIFIDPAYQKKGFGKEAMLEIEKQHPKVRKWKLETPSESLKLHDFYESLGYKKIAEKKDKKSGMIGFIYEKYL